MPPYDAQTRVRTDRLKPGEVLTARFVRADHKKVQQARDLRREARALLEKVSRGTYDNEDLRRFWTIISSASLTLLITNSELSDRAELGLGFFTSVVRDRRRPKLQNMLRALSAVISAVDERLSEIDGRTLQEAPAGSAWISNAFYDRRADIEDLESNLRNLIEFLRGKNEMSADGELDAYWRTSLIQTLETALTLLKAPLVEKGLINRARDGIVTLAKKFPEQFSAGIWAAAATAAVEGLSRVHG